MNIKFILPDLIRYDMNHFWNTQKPIWKNYILKYFNHNKWIIYPVFSPNELFSFTGLDDAEHGNGNNTVKIKKVNR